MDKAQEILKKVLALVKASDSDLIFSPSITSSPQEKEVALKIVRIINCFNYLDSPQFKEMSRGKSAAYVSALERKYSEPSTAKEKKNEFLASVRNLSKSEEIKEFLPPEEHQEIESVRSMLAHW